MVTPFSLANAPSSFQRYINWVLREFLDEFCSAYINDILIYTNGSRSQHQKHVRIVLDRLLQAGLQLDISKYEFEQTQITYLGFVIDARERILMDPAKVKAIQEWAIPTNVRGIRSFIGFANFYRRFIPEFSHTIASLIRLTQKNAIFKIGPDEVAAFKKLKDLFTTDPVLAPFDADRETILYTDASRYASGGTLS